jgi:hypothetical protein
MTKQRLILISVVIVSLLLFAGSFWGVEYFLNSQHSEGEILGVTVVQTENSGGELEITPEQIAEPKLQVDCVANWDTSLCPGYIYTRRDNRGTYEEFGENYVFIFNPSHPNLSVKVNVPITDPIGTTRADGSYKRDYVATSFETLLTNPNSINNNQEPLFGINGDYVDVDFRPQGLNVSEGIIYSGDFATTRSSFAVSRLNEQGRIARIGRGLNDALTTNYNTIGGNGRFYENGEFINICEALGSFACGVATNRSMAAVTSRGFVIFAVHQTRDVPLLPDQFDDFLEPVAEEYNLGTIQDGLLFDGGRSPGFFYEGEVLVENGGPIGSVFMVYDKTR